MINLALYILAGGLIVCGAIGLVYLMGGVVSKLAGLEHDDRWVIGTVSVVVLMLMAMFGWLALGPYGLNWVT